jgi:adenylate cyclase
MPLHLYIGVEVADTLVKRGRAFQIGEQECDGSEVIKATEGIAIREESDGDLMGDGVNIAARLEGIAKAGAICLSEDAYRQVKARLNLAVSDLGATQLKNIAEPIRVYSLEVGVTEQKPATNDGSAVLENASARLALPDKPSIAVLSFENMSGDPDQEYLATE